MKNDSLVCVDMHDMMHSYRVSERLRYHLIDHGLLSGANGGEGGGGGGGVVFCGVFWCVRGGGVARGCRGVGVKGGGGGGVVGWV